MRVHCAICNKKVSRSSLIGLVVDNYNYIDKEVGTLVRVCRKCKKQYKRNNCIGGDIQGRYLHMAHIPHRIFEDEKYSLVQYRRPSVEDIEQVVELFGLKK